MAVLSTFRLLMTPRAATAVALMTCALGAWIWRPQTDAVKTHDPAHTQKLLDSSRHDEIPPQRLPEKTGSAEQLVDDVQQELKEAKPTILGSWRDDFYGKRIFHFRDDGTAEMAIELDSVGALIYGPKLKFFIAWQIDGDVLKLKMTGGEPKSAFAAAKIFGESSEQRIESLEANEMKLRSLDSNKLYVHHRVDEMP